MEPTIPDGAYALFKSGWLTPQDGEVGLFIHRDATDADTGAHVTVKRYRPIVQRVDGEPQIGGALHPDNPAYQPIPLTEEIRPYARFIAVLRPTD